MGIKAIIAAVAILAVAPASAGDVFSDAASQAAECINQRINAERIPPQIGVQLIRLVYSSGCDSPASINTLDTISVLFPEAVIDGNK